MGVLRGLLHLGQQLIPDQEWALHSFPADNLGALEVLILIPTPSHLTVTHLSANLKPPLVNVKRSMSENRVTVIHVIADQRRLPKPAVPLVGTWGQL